MVCGSITLNSKRIAMPIFDLDSKVNPIASNPNLNINLVAPFDQRSAHLLFKWAFSLSLCINSEILLKRRLRIHRILYIASE